jgi:hypothetical protein
MTSAKGALVSAWRMYCSGLLAFIGMHLWFGHFALIGNSGRIFEDTFDRMIRNWRVTRRMTLPERLDF